MRSRRFSSGSLVAAVMLAVAIPASGATFIVPEDAALIDSSPVIVVARATSARSERDTKGMIVTIHQMVVDDVLKGTADSTIEVVTLGGFVGNKGLSVPGVPEFRNGQKSLLFLVKGDGGRWLVRGMALGKFDFVTRPGGRTILLRGADDGGLFGFDALTKEPYMERVRDARFLDYIRETVNGLKPAADYFTVDDYNAQIAALSQNVSPLGVPKSPYLMSVGDPAHGPRRAQFDSAGSVSFDVNVVTTMSGIDTNSAVDSALAAWTDDAYSSVSFYRGGTTSDTLMDMTQCNDPNQPGYPNCTSDGVEDDVNEILLGMPSLPYGDGGNVVGLNFNWMTFDTYTIESETFYPIVESDIGVDDSAASFGQSGVEQILTHEAGHALGFRHSNEGSPSSNAAIMHSTIVEGGTYGSALQTWDSDAVESVYGDGPPCFEMVVRTGTPTDTSVAYNAGTTLNAIVDAGSAPTHFQWYKKTGATWQTTGSDSPALSTGNLIQTTQYYADYWNACTSPTKQTREATVTVGQCVSPTINTHPASKTINSGKSTTLSVSASGSSTLTYRWYRGASGNDSSPISGATSSSLNTGALTTTSSFWVRVTNDCGTADSDTATVTVEGDCSPNITTQPLSQAIISGASASLSVAATGTTPFTYQWYKGTSGTTSAPIAGATSATYNTGPLTVTSTFWVRVTNSCGATDSATATITICTPAITTQPLSQEITSGSSASLSVATTGTAPFTYQWYKGASGDTSAPIAGATSATYNTGPLTVTSSFWVRVTNSCGTANSATATITIPNSCQQAVIATHPTSQSTPYGATATLSVSATGDAPFTYQWYMGTAGDITNPITAATGATYTTPVLTATTSYWVKVTNACNTVDSNTAVVTVTCSTPIAPTISLSPGLVWSGQLFTVTLGPLTGVSSYQVDESTTLDFSSPTTHTVTGTSISFAKIVSQQTKFYYRARAIADCNGSISANSLVATESVVLPPSPTSPEPEGAVPFGGTDDVEFDIFIPGDLGASGVGASDVQFTATSSEPWMTLDPSSGTLPPEGTTITATVDPAGLPVGANTASVLVETTTSSKGGPSIRAGTVLSVPVSVSLVTPVSPLGPTQPSASSLIIPQVAHTGGVNSFWVTDVRILNTLLSPTSYKVVYTPSGPGGPRANLQTSLTILGGATTALNDLLKNWYSQTGGARGGLEIRPPDSATKAAAAQLANATIVTSRTFNKSPDGTYGQLMPAIPYASFVGQELPEGGPAVLHLQQIAQSQKFRTEVGLIEAAGKSVSGELIMYESDGTELGRAPFSLGPGESLQKGFFPGVSASDARVEIRVTSGDGRIAAYAGVVDNYSSDPILVPATELTRARGTRWVLSGIVNFNTGAANWRSDVRLFNAGDAPVDATVTFYPTGNPDNSQSVNVMLEPGRLALLNDIIQETFGRKQVFGEVVITTTEESSIVTTARSYDQRPANDPNEPACPNSPVGCTFGQFVPAVTPDSVNVRGLGDYPLYITQLEESERFRTNVAVAEVTGQPVKVRISATVPGSLSSPSATLDLRANQMIQIPSFMRDWLRLGTNVYNARIAVQVLEGDGRVMAYGSVVDNRTQDPTYIPAQ